MDKKIFIINGQGGVGKDTFVQFVSDRYSVINVDSVALVKEAAKILGWDGNKDESGRLLLCDLKQLANKHLKHSFNYISNKISVFENDSNKVMFIHIREPEEIEYIKQYAKFEGFDCNTVLVLGGNQHNYGNPSDDNVNHYIYDTYIVNDSNLESLKQESIKFMEEFINE